MSKIVFFDLETTGIERDPNNVRIVEISAIKVDTDTLEEIDRLYYKCNNGDVPISPGATAVHGISEEDVKDLPTFHMLAKDVYKFFEGCDIGGYYSTFYDVPILNMSFLRAGLNWNFRQLKNYDIYTLYKKIHTGKLVDVYKMYTGKELENAHCAIDDISATVDVYRKQRQLGEEFDEDDLTPYKLNVDMAGNFKIRVNDQGDKEIYIDFGKHKGKSIFNVDAAYYNWMANSPDTFPLDTRHYAKKIYEKLTIK